MPIKIANEENIEVHLTLKMTYFSLGDTTRVFLSVDLDEDSDKSDVISLSSNSQEVISRYLNNKFFNNVIYVKSYRNFYRNKLRYS